MVGWKKCLRASWKLGPVRGQQPRRRKGIEHTILDRFAVAETPSRHLHCFQRPSSVVVCATRWWVAGDGRRWCCDQVAGIRVLDYQSDIPRGWSAPEIQWFRSFSGANTFCSDPLRNNVCGIGCAEAGRHCTPNTEGGTEVRFNLSTQVFVRRLNTSLG